MPKLTTYKRPPITEQIRAARSFPHLVAIRDALIAAALCGAIDAERKTLLQWEEAIVNKILEFMLAAPDASALCLIYNSVRTWPRHPYHETLVEAMFASKAAALPSPTEQLKFDGIEIVGVTEAMPRPVNLELKAANLTLARHFLTPSSHA